MFYFIVTDSFVSWYVCKFHGSCSMIFKVIAWSTIAPLSKQVVLFNPFLRLSWWRRVLAPSFSHNCFYLQWTNLSTYFCRSFLYGGSTAFLMYAYCFYYYFERSDMSGFMQISFYFGYMTCICYGVFLALGTVGFRASLLFVRFIYGSIKCE